MATKEATKPVNEVGIIGQMYEDRKTGKKGVLESREPKYKTLMLRGEDNKSFNITYSTFKSNWRKYQGEVVIETSTQKEEKKAEKKKVEEKVKKDIETKSEKIKFSTEDKVKAVRVLEKFIEDRISANSSALKVSRNSRGGIIVGAKRLTVFEVWCKYGIDKYDIFFRDSVADSISKAEFNALKNTPKTEYTEHETWKLRHGYRVDNSELGTIIDKLIIIGDSYIKSTEETKKKATKKTEKTEEE